MVVLVVTIIIIIILLMRANVESYDFRKKKSVAMQIVDAAVDRGRFSESNLRDLKNIVEPLLKNDEDLLSTILDYAERGNVDEVRDILTIYFDAYIKAT
jgi:hypothetical protein